MKTWMTAAAIALTACVAEAQAYGPYVTYYPAATTYYAPAPAPVAYVAASPVVIEAPPPVVTAYYAPPAVVYQPAARVVTRYRPILGGSVSRVRYGYVPVAYYP